MSEEEKIRVSLKNGLKEVAKSYWRAKAINQNIEFYEGELAGLLFACSCARIPDSECKTIEEEARHEVLASKHVKKVDVR